MASLNLTARMQECLKSHPGERFTARQIAEWILHAYPVECQRKKQESQRLGSDEALLNQLAAEIAARRPKLQKEWLKTTEGRPRKYYYSEESDAAEVEAAESGQGGTVTDSGPAKIVEQELYPILSSYLWEEFRLYSKRIDEKRSSNKRGPNGNRWLYPDVVAMEDLGAEWHREVRECVASYSDKRTRLWSFEVKLLINRSNI